LFDYAEQLARAFTMRLWDVVVVKGDFIEPLCERPTVSRRGVTFDAAHKCGELIK
jgi:hypothetical protein